MTVNHWQRSLKRWLFLVLVLAGLLTPATGSFAAGSCSYLSSGNFGDGSGWYISQGQGTYWSIADGKLDADNLTSTSSYAWTDFRPDDFFTIDVEVDILNSSSEYDRVGIYFTVGGDVFFGVQGSSGEYTTDGVLCYYYPTSRKLEFKVYDFSAGKWVTPLAAYPFSGSVRSIGFNLVADGVIFRINGQDTAYKIRGDFSFVPMTIDTLFLYAGGAGLHARFDNVCAGPGEAGDFPTGSAMPLPFGTKTISTSPAASPVVNNDPAAANPLGFGPAASGGNNLTLTAGLSGVNAPVDLYVGIGIGGDLYLFDSQNQLHSYSREGRLVKWRTNTTGGFSNTPLLPTIDMSGFPGTYDFYFLMAPTGRLDAFYLWFTQLHIAGGGPGPVTNTGMEQKIRQNLDLIFGLTSGFSGGLDEVTKLFEDSSVVSKSPANANGDLNLMAVLQGSPLSIAFNFGSGHRLQSGTVMAGNGRLDVTNVNFGKTGMGADFAATFNNITKDGTPFANGQLRGNLALTEAPGDKANISGQVNISSLALAGRQLSGTINISGILDKLDLGALLNMDMAKMLETTGNIRLTFTNFVAGDYTITSGTVDIVSTQGGRANITTDLNTSEGPVQLNLTTIIAPTGITIRTNAPGTMGPYTTTINNLTFDPNVCPNYPTGGSLAFTPSGATGPTGVVTFTGACDGTYQYGER